MNNLSLIYPVYNEEKVIAENLLKTFDFLKASSLDFEILVVDNGSKDKTEEQAGKIIADRPEIRFIKLGEKGLGLAIRKGVDTAKFNNAMFYAIDLPFGLDIILESLNELDGNDIVIGSKSHKKSVNKAPLKRKTVSFIFNLILRIAFRIKVRDTQGSLIFKKDRIGKILDFCKAKDAFFCTQLIIYANRCGLAIKEIPVLYEKARGDSKIRIVNDGSSLLKQVLQEYKEIKKIA